MAIDFFSELNGLAPGAVGCGRDKRPSPTTQPASKMKTLLTIALVVGMFSYAGAQTFGGNLHMAETATGGSVTGQGTTGTAFPSNSAATGQVAATSNAFAGTTADIHDFDINGVVKASVDSGASFHAAAGGGYASLSGVGATDFQCGIDGGTV